MAKKKTVRKKSSRWSTSRKTSGLQPTGEQPEMDEADGVRTGRGAGARDEAPVYLPRAQRNGSPLPCGRFIASPTKVSPWVGLASGTTGTIRLTKR